MFCPINAGVFTDPVFWNFELAVRKISVHGIRKVIVLLPEPWRRVLYVINGIIFAVFLALLFPVRRAFVGVGVAFEFDVLEYDWFFCIVLAQIDFFLDHYDRLIFNAQTLPRLHHRLLFLELFSYHHWLNALRRFDVRLFTGKIWFFFHVGKNIHFLFHFLLSVLAGHAGEEIEAAQCWRL